MKYLETVTGTFINRPNRFIAQVLVQGKEETVHVKNTGRCKELLIPGAKIILEKAQNENRKTKYSLVAVYKGNLLINMDSQIPNAVAAEALSSGRLKEIGAVSHWRREVPYGASRFDLYYEEGSRKGFIEVKGVTLEQDGIARFPDAPSERASKHLKGLIKAKEAGFESTVLFLIQMKGPKMFTPNFATDSHFSENLQKAAEKGVSILVYDSLVEEDEIVLGNAIPCKLSEKTT